jgi:hypothetical protein
LICEYLKSNQTIEDIDLQNNQISDEDLEHLCNVLKVNKTIQKINLKNNLITDNGAVSLLEFVKFNRFILSIELENNDIDEKLLLKFNSLDSSNILNLNDKIELENMLPIKKQWNCIFRGSRDGFSSHTFHQKCDGKGPTIVIVKSEFGNIFGGFSPISWGKSGNDLSTFLFSLKNWTGMSFKFCQKNNTNVGSIESKDNNGPIFGSFNSKYDLSISDNCDQNKNSSMRWECFDSEGLNIEKGLKKNVDAKFFSGEKYSCSFKVIDYEVFN